jgi:hypothetical protein
MVPMTDHLCRGRIAPNNGIHVFNGVPFSGKVTRIEQKTSFGFKPRVWPRPGLVASHRKCLDEKPGRSKRLEASPECTLSVAQAFFPQSIRVASILQKNWRRTGRDPVKYWIRRGISPSESIAFGCRFDSTIAANRSP